MSLNNEIMTINLAKGHFNAVRGHKVLKVNFNDLVYPCQRYKFDVVGYESRLPDIAEAYETCLAAGMGNDEIIDMLINLYFPLRFFRVGSYENMAMVLGFIGMRGSGKTWEHRYHLVQFGRGFMRLALQTKTPIVPVAVIGGEESIISLYNVKPLARLLGTPYFPISPWLPVLGLAAYLPLPVRFYLHFGEPMHFSGLFDDEDEIIDEKVIQVMDRIQTMINKGLERAIAQKKVTYDLARQMEGATEVKCSEFAEAIVANL